MNVKSKFSLELGDKAQTYYELLNEEDYNFKTKDIKVEVIKAGDSKVDLEISCNSVLDLKIGANAVIKSLEIIDKTLKV